VLLPQVAALLTLFAWGCISLTLAVLHVYVAIASRRQPLAAVAAVPVFACGRLCAAARLRALVFRLCVLDRALPCIFARACGSVTVCAPPALCESRHRQACAVGLTRDNVYPRYYPHFRLSLRWLRTKKAVTQEQALSNRLERLVVQRSVHAPPPHRRPGGVFTVEIPGSSAALCAVTPQTPHHFQVFPLLMTLAHLPWHVAGYGGGLFCLQSSQGVVGTRLVPWTRTPSRSWRLRCARVLGRVTGDGPRLQLGDRPPPQETPIAAAIPPTHHHLRVSKRPCLCCVYRLCNCAVLACPLPWSGCRPPPRAAPPTPAGVRPGNGSKEEGGGVAASSRVGKAAQAGAGV
jgi:hypothetical protein